MTELSVVVCVLPCLTLQADVFGHPVITSMLVSCHPVVTLSRAFADVLLFTDSEWWRRKTDPSRSLRP